MLTPEKFAETPVYDLLAAAGAGKVGVDLRWARSIVDRGEAAVGDLVRFGVEDRSGDPVILDDQLLVLFRQLRSPASIPYFVELLRRSSEYELPEELEDAIYPLRHEALEPLIQLYGEMEEEESGEVAFLLASFRIHDNRVLRILLDRLEYDLLDAAIALSLYGDPASREPLEKLLAASDDEYVKIELQHTLDDLGRAADEEAEEPFDIAEYFPDKSVPEVSVLDDADLLEVLGSDDVEYREAAARGFFNRDLDPPTLAAILDRARSDSEPGVRAACWESLANEVSDNAEVYKAMLSRLEDESVPLAERAGALMGLGQKANEEPVRRYAVAFYENPETRAAALCAMWNSLDRTFAEYFPKHLDDSDLDIRKHAISGVGYLGIYDAAERLRQFFDHEDLRANALFAYALSARSEISPARVRSLFRRIEEFAGGFAEEEEELVKIALDERLMLHGHKPVFHASEHRHHEHGPDCDHDHDLEPQAAPEPVAAPAKAGRNDPCPCGSGKKYKKCCGA